MTRGHAETMQGVASQAATAGVLSGDIGMQDAAAVAGSTKVRAITSRNSAHVIAYRISLPLFGQRYYFALFSGHEQRNPARLEAEAQRKPWSHTLFGFLAVIGGVSTALICTLAIAYLVKTLLGFDLLEEKSFLHHLFFD